MAWKYSSELRAYEGVSSDPKPTGVPSESLGYETDTYLTYVFDGVTWHLLCGYKIGGSEPLIPAMRMNLNQVKSQLRDTVRQQGTLRSKNMLTPVLLESFKTTADFGSLTRCTLSQDTVNFKTGTSALAMTCTTAGNSSTFQKTVSWDLSTAIDFELKAFIPDKTAVFALSLIFMNASGGQLLGYRTFFENGDNTFRFSQANMGVAWGTISFADIITTVMIKIDVPAAVTPPTITFDSLKKNVKEPSRVIFVLDDGFTSAYTIAYPYLQNNGLKACVAAFGSAIGGGNYMTMAQLKDLYANGWDILNHSWTHPDFSVMTYTNVAGEVQKMRDYLTDNGFTRGGDVFIYPGGYTILGAQVLKDLGYLAARNSVGYINYQGCDLMKLQAQCLIPAATFAPIQKSIDGVKATGGTLVIFAHDLMDSPSTMSQSSTILFKQVVDYVVASGVEAVTASKWENGLFS